MQQLEQQVSEIDEVNATLRVEGLKFRVLPSVELTLTLAVLAIWSQLPLHRFDVMLGCFHSALRKKADQTERYLAALRNPDIQVLGQPRGRVYNFRLVHEC